MSRAAAPSTSSWAAPRRSRDIGLFHDTEAALVATWAADRAAIESAGPRVETIRELPAFVEARVSDGTEAVLVQWTRDSAFRFYPVQSLGYLAWAAAGKDPGFSPLRIVEECARTRYVQSELDALDFDGPAPSAAELSKRWHAAIVEARDIVAALPADEAGKCVLDPGGQPLKVPAAALPAELSGGGVAFHEGRIRGAFPEVREARA